MAERWPSIADDAALLHALEQVVTALETIDRTARTAPSVDTLHTVAEQLMQAALYLHLAADALDEHP